MDFALLHQLALCCLLMNSDYRTNEFTPALNLETQVVKIKASGAYTAGLIRLKSCRVLVFRGTVNDWKGARTATMMDWVKNFQQGQVDAPNVPGKVHRGIQGDVVRLLAYEEQSLVKHLKRMAETDPLPLYVTGHSQGGASALLAAAQLHHHGVAVKEVVLFASPRVGDVAFGDYCRLHLKVHRLEKEDDLVPLLPLSSTESDKIQRWIARGKKGVEIAANFTPGLAEQLKPWDELVELLAGSLPVYDRIGLLTLLTPAPKSIRPEDEEESIKARWRSTFLRSVTKPKSFLAAHDSRAYVEILGELK